MSADKFQVEQDWITRAGLRAVVTLGTIGFRCGYVGVPISHPLHGADYNNAAPAEGEYFDVHGGLTYSDADETYPVAAPDLWWFGYDCGHLYDARTPEYLSTVRARYPGKPFMWEEDAGSVERSTAYCVNECERLAEQLAKLSPTETTIHRTTEIAAEMGAHLPEGGGK